MRADNLAALDTMSLADLEISLDLHTRERVPVTRYTAFSWSVQRHNVFERCKREYYLQYYATRRVVEANNRAVSAVWWLKQAIPLRVWIGQVLHHAAATAVCALRDGGEIGEDELTEQALTYYREGVEASRRGIKHDGAWRVLFEHIYPGEPYSIDRDRAEPLVIDLTHMLLESDAYQWLRRLPRTAIREVDPPFQSFELPDVPRLGRVRVFAIPDVLVLHEGKVHIIDWKTGDAEDQGIRHQAGVYRLYAHRTYRVPEDAINFVVAGLSGGESGEPPGVRRLTGAPGIAETEAFVRESIYNMVSCMEDVAHNTATIKAYPMTDDLTLCQRCGFRRACWRHEASPHE